MTNHIIRCQSIFIRHLQNDKKKQNKVERTMINRRNATALNERKPATHCPPSPLFLPSYADFHRPSTSDTFTWGFLPLLGRGRVGDPALPALYLMPRERVGEWDFFVFCFFLVRSKLVKSNDHLVIIVFVYHRESEIHFFFVMCLINLSVLL